MENHPHLKDLQALGPLEVFRADLEDEGSFDEAVAGCDYAFLVAAPMNLNAENPEVEPDQTVGAASPRSATSSSTLSCLTQLSFSLYLSRE